MKKEQFSVAAFYNFVTIEKPEEFQAEAYSFLHKQLIKGTLLIASEGLNGTLSGAQKSIENLKDFLISRDLFSAANFKLSFSKFSPFPRLKVKLKKEIVTIGDPSIDPRMKVGKYIAPEAWNEFISEENVLVLDTRNTYEVSIGTFPGAVQPNTTNFREFPEWVNSLEESVSKDQKIAMFCTGGIRCEKASSLMIEKGFNNVFHLQGGILNYLEKINPKDSLWKGECFVFDDRVALDSKLEKGSYDLCHGCRMPITKHDKNSKEYVRGVSCPYCFSSKTKEQKKRYADRQMQVDLAKKRNQKHIGSKDEVRKK
ncbi:MAG: rhodanese-related sulfurtransferase [Gammaproteobacteria bacterium]